MILDWSGTTLQIKALCKQRDEKLNMRDYATAKQLGETIDAHEAELRKWIREKMK